MDSMTHPTSAHRAPTKRSREDQTNTPKPNDAKPATHNTAITTNAPKALGDSMYNLEVNPEKGGDQKRCVKARQAMNAASIIAGPWPVQ
jgi:hypothetical protein